jgi:membrane protein YdbS with pleckstrin-like domain
VTERFPPDDAAAKNDARSGTQDHGPQEPDAPAVTAPSNATGPASEPSDEKSKPETATTTVDCEFQFEQLDRRWIGLVRTIETMTWMAIGAPVLVVGTVGLLAGQPPIQTAIPVAWLLLSLLAVFRVIWWPRLVYKHWSYRIGKKVFELRHGILWQVSVAIPLSRLQHIDLHRGPLERRRGLASVQLHTAGTKEASQLIPGLDFGVAQTLRDRLIDAANRGTSPAPSGSAPSGSAPSGSAPSGSATSGSATSGRESSGEGNNVIEDGH